VNVLLVDRENNIIPKWFYVHFDQKIKTIYLYQIATFDKSMIRPKESSKPFIKTKIAQRKSHDDCLVVGSQTSSLQLPESW